MRRGLWRGAVAGFLGGVVASVVMNAFQSAWTSLFSKGRGARHAEQGGQVHKGFEQRRPEREGESATEKTATAMSRALRGRGLGAEEKTFAGAPLHLAFGAAVGAAYGAAAELEPQIASGFGVPFGAAVWLAADEIGVPALGLSKTPAEYPLEMHAQSLASHVVYGAVTEAMRKFVRGTSGA